MSRDLPRFEIYFQSFSVDEVLNIVYPLGHLRSLSKQLKPFSYVFLKLKLFKLIKTKPCMCTKCTYCIDKCFKLKDYSKYDLITITEIIKETEKLNEKLSKNNELREGLSKFLGKKIHGFVTFLPDAINYQNLHNCKILKKLLEKEVEIETKLETAYITIKNIQQSTESLLKHIIERI